MQIQQEITDLLQQTFVPTYCQVENESHMHNVPPGSESHFKVVMAATAFTGKRLVQRHQLVYGALTEQMVKIHALALHLYTPEEWAAQGESAPDSPNCMGGGH
jgi:BolA protein